MKRLKVQTHQLVSDLIDGFDNQLDALQASLETEHAKVVLNINTLYAEKEEERRGAFVIEQRRRG
jgi:ABC-type phosphate transport system auxiliary subunit